MGLVGVVVTGEVSVVGPRMFWSILVPSSRSWRSRA